eukprot:CAMPEP_0170333370 /NCGR_PEP_ID=MMETSP0116_2-20130129/67707_1 /TAXON_ID=400756 /ORGANISM="Durinskia baltica, Strain CSIRO CS-38" /LENGTH=69 /DNA_ID=CAMNT_0010586717 /DNA_START=9 /DNA_END=215 /DNA_ORIENTATION=+
MRHERVAACERLSNSTLDRCHGKFPKYTEAPPRQRRDSGPNRGAAADQIYDASCQCESLHAPDSARSPR